MDDIQLNIVPVELVLVADKPVEAEVGGHTEEELEHTEVVLVSTVVVLGYIVVGVPDCIVVEGLDCIVEEVPVNQGVVSII